MRNELDVFDGQNRPHSGLYVLLTRNFTFSQSAIRPLKSSEIGVLEHVSRRKAECCTKYKNFVDSVKSEIVSFPICCDNRSCSNQQCKDHRLYKFMSTHGSQIRTLNESMRSPKGFIFTGWKLKPPVDRGFCQAQLKKIFRLLSDKKHGCVSEFSIHMELKPELDGSFYLHFHVVMAGVKDLRFVRAAYGRVIRYEKAIKPDELGFYVSKYASKVPAMVFAGSLEYFSVAVHKLQMHRFSCSCSREGKRHFSPYIVDNLREFYERNERHFPKCDARFIPEDFLLAEVDHCLGREAPNSGAFLEYRRKHTKAKVHVNDGDRNKQEVLF